MEQITHRFLLIVLAYILGSIPSAFIAGKLIRNIDIRKHGSGNVGATNTLRILGKKWGVVVLLCDIFKGFAAVVFLPQLFAENPSPSVLMLLTVAAVAGHNWTIFLNFRGGKGVATSLGSLLGLGIYNHTFFLVIVFAFMVWGTVFFITRIVSAASVIAAASLPIFVYFFSKEFIALSFLITLFVLIRHIPNIRRLIRGKEEFLEPPKK